VTLKLFKEDIKDSCCKPGSVKPHATLKRGLYLEEKKEEGGRHTPFHVIIVHSLRTYN
jgi:elongation factor Tu